jgi:hypothetical protein
MVKEYSYLKAIKNKWQAGNKAYYSDLAEIKIMPE